jgi:hypothetical protein
VAGGVPITRLKARVHERHRPRNVKVPKGSQPTRLVCRQRLDVALDARAGERRLREVAVSGGSDHFWRAAETPFRLILEARP